MFPPALVLAALVPFFCCAQEIIPLEEAPDVVESTREVHPEAPEKVIVEERKVVRIDIDFDGGTLSQLLHELKAAVSPLNVISGPDIYQVQVPPFKVQDVDLETLFNSLTFVTPLSFNKLEGQAEDGDLFGVKSSSSPIWIVNSSQNRDTAFNDAGYSVASDVINQKPGGGARQSAGISKRISRMRTSTGASPRSGNERTQSLFRSLSAGASPPRDSDPHIVSSWIDAVHSPPKESHPVAVADMLKVYSVDDITTAILKSWESLDDKHACKITFHKDADLLILSGTPNMLALADSVLNAMRTNIEIKQTDGDSNASKPTLDPFGDN